MGTLKCPESLEGVLVDMLYWVDSLSPGDT